MSDQSIINATRRPRTEGAIMTDTHYQHIDCEERIAELTTELAKFRARDRLGELNITPDERLEKRVAELTAECERLKKTWRCFHCDEVFTDHAAAREHFGESMCDDPACQIDMTDVRAMENQLRQYREEDTALHRELRRMETDHRIALRREEEKGYARGVQDATAELEVECKRLREALREAIAQMESDAVFHEYDRGHRSISEMPDSDLPDALLHARAALAQEPT